MAATDKTYHNQRTLDIIFAASCILMLVCTIWMLVADYNREFKTVQRNFRDVESVLDERQMINQLPDPDEVKERQTAVVEKRKAVDAAKEKVRPDEQRLTAERDQRTDAYQSIKADFDSKTSFYNIEISERDQAGLSQAVRRERAERVAARKQEIDKLQAELDNAQKAVDQTAEEYKLKVTDPVNQAQNDLGDAEDAEKKLTANFDRFAKLAVQKQWGFGDTFRALPILDAFESPTKIRQIVLSDLPIEYGSFKFVTRYDRCTSCHLAVERGAFDHTTLTKLTRTEKETGNAWREAALTADNELAGLVSLMSEDDQKTPRANVQAVKAALDKADRDDYKSAENDPNEVAAKLNDVLHSLRASEVPGAKTYGPLDREIAHVKELGDQLQEARSLPRKMETARRLLQNRKDKGDNLGFDPGDLPSRPRTVSLTPGQITQYAAHPRLDLFVDSNSAHPMEKFGCTVCHGGQGSATDFLLSAHTPDDAAQHKQWEEEYHWHGSHDWEFPMLPNRFVESSCVKCHHEVTDLVRQGNKEEAPKLLRGFNLVRENGCFGCHEISGIKKGQEIGPDLRLEPAPALAWLSPTDQEKAKADPLNPPGTYRKVGPSLRRIAEKTNEEWARRWIQSPRGFRPDTKMPHFYNLSTNNPDVLPEQQKDFPAAEIHSIAHYLFDESARSLEGKDTYRVGLQQQLQLLQEKLKEGALDERDRKELADVTHRLGDLALLSIPIHSGEIDGVATKLRQTQDAVLELYEKVRLTEERIKDDQKRPDDKKAASDLEQATQDRDAGKQELENVKKDLDPLRLELEKIGQPIPIAKQIVDAQGDLVAGALPEADKNDLAKHLTEGRRLFSERGCLACHVHDGVRQKGADGLPAVSEEAASFAPDLSRIAAKIAPQKGDAKARRRWVVQWVLNPNIYHPRTHMPIMHLTVQEACEVADWLLSQEIKPAELADWKDPAEPAPETLVALARLYLLKAPGMTAAKVNEVLPADAGELDKIHGYSEEDLKYATYDADERVLQGPITRDKLEWYIGRKSINRLGCYGCHDLPGFETAKPIGTALNDWGAKDPERLAFEDADVYVRGRHNIVDARDAANNPHQPAADWQTKDGKTPYESYFYNALEHHQRDGFLNEKLAEPRSYDYNRIRVWDDRLRMPQFKFAKSRRRAGEADESYENRQQREEAEAREAVMTFILGLVAEPIPLKYVSSPTPDRLAEAKGRKVLDQYNCVGCHQVRPGVYDFKPTKDTLDALERVYQSYANNQAKKDHAFPGHNAWTGAASPWPDRLTAHGTQPRVEEDENLLNLRLTEALRFTNNDRIVRDIPAGMTAKLVPEDLIDQAPVYGGAFSELLIPYLAQTNSTLFGGKPDEARSVLPPPLMREGERVQPKWLYQFLLNPGTVRPQEKMKLRMPKFNMSGEDAMTLVNYFGAVAQQTNPGAGVTYPYLKIEQIDAKYWDDRNKEYLELLKAVGGADGKGLDQRAKDLLGEMKKGVQLHLDAVKAAAAAAAKGDDKTHKEAEIKELQATIEKWDKQIKDGNVGDLVKEWKSPDAYAADAYRLVAANPNICTKCHSIGALKIDGPNGPDLSIAFERLRPEWTFEWISNPDRMFAYSPTMPQNFPKDSVDYKEYFAGAPRDRARAARDVLMDLPRLDNLPANRATRAAITGGK
jgi:mono/diheme cytochrome c family protein/cbb3-type cytochrome oxidase cytochrome c subunit